MNDLTITDTERRAAVFAILATGGEDGLMGKSPDYLAEKFLAVMEREIPEGLLDHPNSQRLIAYADHWHRTLCVF